jgi:hypothetical protein
MTRTSSQVSAVRGAGIWSSTNRKARSIMGDLIVYAARPKDRRLEDPKPAPPEEPTPPAPPHPDPPTPTAIKPERPF